MFLKELDLSKKKMIILAVVTVVFIAALAIFIGFMDIGVKDKPTDLDFLGYRFIAGQTEVEMKTPVDEPFMTEISNDTIHGLETLSATINNAYRNWTALIRNALIFIYLLIFILLLWKKKETYSQGVFKGFLIGMALVLLFVIIYGIFDLRTLLISFEHDIAHMLFPG